MALTYECSFDQFWSVSKQSLAMMVKWSVMKVATGHSGWFAPINILVSGQKKTPTWRGSFPLSLLHPPQGVNRLLSIYANTAVNRSGFLQSFLYNVYIMEWSAVLTAKVAACLKASVCA